MCICKYTLTGSYIMHFSLYLVCLKSSQLIVRIYSITLVAQLVKNPSAMWETWVQSLGWEDSLEKGRATHSSILAWRIPWTEEPGRLQSLESQRAGHNWVTFTFIQHHNIGFHGWPSWAWSFVHSFRLCLPWVLALLETVFVRYLWSIFCKQFLLRWHEIMKQQAKFGKRWFFWQDF